MDQKAPPALLRILFATAALSFGLSMYLEQRQLDWLQRHPISANLLTSVVGFATGGLVVAIFFTGSASAYAPGRRRGRRGGLTRGRW